MLAALYMSLFCLSTDGGHQLRLPDSFQTSRIWHRGVLGSQVQGRQPFTFHKDVVPALSFFPQDNKVNRAVYLDEEHEL